MKTKLTPNSHYSIKKGAGDTTVLQLNGRIDTESSDKIIKGLIRTFKKRLNTKLIVDLKNVNYLDDYGAMLLVEIKKLITANNGSFTIENAGDEVNEMLDILNFSSLGRQDPFTRERSPNIFIRLGDAAISYFSDLKDMCIFIGSVCLALLYTLRHPRSLRVNDTIDYMQKTGVDALPIVGLISFLLGLIMAFMSSVSLQQFGANIYVASLVSLSMVRELGPIMTAIIVAGRSGSAFAAEIGTMKINEEVDALFTMGFDTSRFLVVPKVLAAVAVVPILALFSDIFAITGGLIVGVGMLDLTANAYLTQTFKTLTLFDVVWGAFKCGIFAFLIALIGCLRGFQVKGGAASVGQATTSSVVSSIFLVILSDSIFAVVLRYWS